MTCFGCGMTGMISTWDCGSSNAKLSKTWCDETWISTTMMGLFPCLVYLLYAIGYSGRYNEFCGDFAQRSANECILGSHSQTRQWLLWGAEEFGFDDDHHCDENDTHMRPIDCDDDLEMMMDDDNGDEWMNQKLQCIVYQKSPSWRMVMNEPNMTPIIILKNLVLISATSDCIS